jgi:hypothetical protein
MTDYEIEWDQFELRIQQSFIVRDREEADPTEYEYKCSHCGATFTGIGANPEADQPLLPPLRSARTGVPMLSRLALRTGSMRECR